MSLLCVSSCGDSQIESPFNESGQTLYQPSYDETFDLVQQIVCNDKTIPPWIEAIGKWLKAHSGKAQQFHNGQPICDGNYSCGPCAGFCPFPPKSIYGFPNGDDGQLEEVTEADFENGFRAAKFSIVQNSESQEEKIMLTLTANISDFVQNGNIYFEENVFLPDTFVLLFEVISIELKAGIYPIIMDGEVGYTIIESVITR